MQNERLNNSALSSLCLHSDYYVCPSVSASVLYAYKLDIFLLILLLQTTLTVAPFPDSTCWMDLGRWYSH